jgi:hypothetical protein
MSEWKLEFCVLLLLGLWTYEVLHVSERIFHSRRKNKLGSNQRAPESRDTPLPGGADPPQADCASHVEPSTVPLIAGEQEFFFSRRRRQFHRHR